MKKLKQKILTFEERARLGMKNLARQRPVTLEEIRKQAQRVRNNSIANNKKQRDK